MTKTFLLDDDLPEFKANRTLQQAIVAHRTSFVALQKSLNEAKLEVWNRSVQSHVKEYEEIVKNMERLAQYMGGLRSSCGLQFELINRDQLQQPLQQQQENQKSPTTRDISKGSSTKINNSIKRSSTMGLPRPNPKKTEIWNVRAGYRRRKMQDHLRRQKTAASYFDLDDQHSQGQYSATYGSPIVDTLLVSSASSNSLGGRSRSRRNGYGTDYDTDYDDDEYGKHAHINDYIANIKKPLKSLAYTCKQTIFHLQAHFHTGVLLSDRTKKSIPSASILKANLVKAIALFEASQRRVLQQPHLLSFQKRMDPNNSSTNKKNKKATTGYTNNNKKNDIDNNEDVINDEEVFLVYFFVFNMVEFARQLIPLVESVGQLAECESSNRHRWYSIFLFSNHSTSDEGRFKKKNSRRRIKIDINKSILKKKKKTNSIFPLFFLKKIYI